MDAYTNKKVLLISFYFPPTNAIAAVRIGKFAKYLPEFGWDPIVLTVNDVFGLSKTLPVEIDESKIIRTPAAYSVNERLIRMIFKKRQSYNNSTLQENINQSGSKISKLLHLCGLVTELPVIEKLIYHPIGWYHTALQAGLKILKANDVKVIFSTYGPSVPHLIAAALHKETGIPWVADYRDNWIDEYRIHPQPLNFLDQQWEKYTLRTCNSIVSHNYPLAKILENSHGKIPTVIPNGFDDSDYKNNIPLIPKFTITYTGSIYPGKRDSLPLLLALDKARQEGSISPQDIEIRFYGINVRECVLPLVKKYNLEDFITLGSNIPYQESIKKQMESTILLLLSWNDPRDAGTLTGKVYEYLGAKRPILAMAYPGGEIDKLLRKSGCGIVVNDPDEIKRLLLVWLNEFKMTGKIRTHFNPDTNIINNYSRKGQTRTLADMFNKVSI